MILNKNRRRTYKHQLFLLIKYKKWKEFHSDTLRLFLYSGIDLEKLRTIILTILRKMSGGIGTIFRHDKNRTKNGKKEILFFHNVIFMVGIEQK